ncbi:MAG: PDZ domain-containing protein, partial [Pirellulales bacterium]|nr:PDZ domain-containing protein [Pirellulales bacterium]
WQRGDNYGNFSGGGQEIGDELFARTGTIGAGPPNPVRHRVAYTIMLLRHSYKSFFNALFRSAPLAAGMLLLAVSASRSVAQQGDSPKSVEQASRLEIEQWIKQLDANRYDVRQLAQRRLVQRGLAALDAVARAAQSGSLESTTRAINILLAWTESADSQLRIAALEKIAALSNRPKESNIATSLLSNAREQAALQAISRLGGHYLQIRGAAYLQVTFGKHWQGGYEGLKHLEEIPHATILSFHSAPLDDRAVQYLYGLAQVQRIEFYGTKVSKSALEKLQEKLPNTIIDSRSAAFLGIHGDAGGIAAVVRRVQPDSAADRAGIRANDKITQVDGENVGDFTALTKRIAQHEPGDSVTLTVVRNRRTIQLKVTFDEWGTQKQKGTLPRGIAPVLMPQKVFIERR